MPEKNGDRAGGHGPPPGQGRGEQWRDPPSPFPPNPPRPAGHGGAGPLPPRGRGGVLLSPERTVTPGGETQLDPHAVRPRAPHCLPPRGSRQAGEPAPARKNGARATPGGGTRQQTGAVWGRRPHDPSVAKDARNVARSGRAEGRTEATQPPGPPAPWPPPRKGGSQAAPPAPPPARLAGRQQAAPGARGCPTTLTERIHLEGMRRRRKGGWAEGRMPPPPEREEGSHGATPPHRPIPPP